MNEALFEAVLCGVGSGVTIWKLEDANDPSQLRLTFANPSACRFFGVESAAAVGRLIGEIEHVAVRGMRAEVIARVARTGVAASMAVAPDSDRKSASMAKARLLPLPDRCVGLVVESAADPQRNEDDARRLTMFLDSIVENIPAMVFVKDADELRMQLFNRGAERLTGRKREDVLGRNPHEVGLPPEQAAFFEQKDREVLQKGVLVDIPEEPVQTRTGERRWLHTKKIPILDEAGRATYLLGISLDITERKHASEALKAAHEELERRVAERTADLMEANRALQHQIEERQRAEEALAKAEAQLRQAQKMEAIGRLAGGVAHDFNNLLSVIIGCSAVLTANGVTGHVAEGINEIRKAGERAAELTRQLLAFSRQQVRAPTILDLNDVITGMNGMLCRVIGEDIELETVQASDLAAIHADGSQVEQVIMNLVINARDAMPEGGRLRIETANVVIDEEAARHHVGLTPGRHVMLAVVDSGVGIDPAVQDAIFEPFFTTKEQGKGTGLGLATVFGIVKQNGGGVFVESQPGKGAAFRSYFPSRNEPAPVAHVAPAGPADQAFSGSETILLVEDHDQVRALVSSILKDVGYRVFEAACPGDALKLEAEVDQTIDLLITDVVMPQMNGRRLADRLRARRPDLEVLFMSGYSDHLVDRDGVLESGIHFLPKPIGPADLARAVRTVLDARKH